jgi:hypothetical protein
MLKLWTLIYIQPMAYGAINPDSEARQLISGTPAAMAEPER